MWTEQFMPYKEALIVAESITIDDVQDAMNSIPLEIQQRLAKGPLPRRYDCAVCVAFGKNFYGDGHVILGDPMWTVYLYHEVPKAKMKRMDQCHYGPLANEIYTRCIETYKAAGWAGVAEEANA